MKKALILTLCALTPFLSCCARTCRDTTLYQKSGRAKPIVAVLPVVDNSSDSLLPWDLSKELTETIRNRVFDSSKLYLLKEAGSPSVTQYLCTPNPTALPKNVRDKLGAAEFVVVSEVLEQKETPYGIQGAEEADKPHLQEVGATLSLAMRLRVIDIRNEQPKIILQEILNHEHVIGRPYLNCNYERCPWGSEAYERTPMGIAHNRLIRELVSRVEGYVGASKG